LGVNASLDEMIAWLENNNLGSSKPLKSLGTKALELCHCSLLSEGLCQARLSGYLTHWNVFTCVACVTCSLFSQKAIKCWVYFLLFVFSKGAKNKAVYEKVGALKKGEK
jgi:hypothetical protein